MNNRLFSALRRAWLRILIADINKAIEYEQAQVDEWALRRSMWLIERSRLESQLDRVRGARSLVKWTLTPKG